LLRTDWNTDQHPISFESENDSISTADEKKILKKFLTNSVSPATAKSYLSGVKKWREYLESLGNNFPGYFLETMKDESDKGLRVVLYMAYLYMNFGLREEQINRLVTGVKFLFEIEGKPSEFFSLAVVSRGRAAGCRNVPESRQHEETRSHTRILPMCIDIVLNMRRELWENKSWSVPDIDQRAIWLAVGLGFNTGPRIGNLTK
jgi:hypothetical protein